MQLEARVRALEKRHGGIEFIIQMWIKDPENRKTEILTILEAIKEETGVSLSLGDLELTHLDEGGKRTRGPASCFDPEYALEIRSSRVAGVILDLTYAHRIDYCSDGDTGGPDGKPYTFLDLRGRGMR